MPLKIAILTSMIACALGGCVAGPFATFEDPRPEGRFSLSERSRCEVPDAPGDRPNGCDYPHEVRAFIDQRDSCDHFRGEPWPEGDSSQERERRRELTSAIKAACTGTDARLLALRAKYRDDANIVVALATYENDIEP